jgi:hypothetical protein
MADKKISALTAASTPLAGTEVLPIVQGASTVKVAVSDLTAGRSVSATSVASGLGLVGTPAYTFTGDTNTGMWSPAADTLAFSEGGAEAMRIDSSGNVGIGTTAPSAKLNVAGDTIISGNADARQIGFNFYGTSQYNFYVDGAVDAAKMTIRSGTTSVATFNGSGNVGIGTSSPAYQLELSTDSAAKPTSALWTIASDSRVKTETGEYTKGLDAVCALRPITYQYNGAAGFTADGKGRMARRRANSLAEPSPRVTQGNTHVRRKCRTDARISGGLARPWVTGG